MNFIVNTSGTILLQTVRKDLVEKTSLNGKTANVHSNNNKKKLLSTAVDRSKRRKLSAQRNSETIQNTLVFSLAAVRTSNLAKNV